MTTFYSVFLCLWLTIHEIRSAEIEVGGNEGNFHHVNNRLSYTRDQLLSICKNSAVNIRPPDIPDDIKRRLEREVDEEGSEQGVEEGDHVYQPL